MTALPTSREPTPRELHYGGFYRLPGSAVPDDRPLLLVHGNCQAEALRVLLEAAPGGTFATLRVPPVHELVAADVDHLHHHLDRASAVVVQPVRDDYHDLPVGTRQVLERCRTAARVVVPVVRHQLLHPFQAIVRSPDGDPPVVPYHDLRTLIRAAGLPAPTPSAAGLRAVGQDALDELRRRQQRHGTLAVDDLLVAAGAAAAHTVNHPGNEVLVALARRVQQTLGADPTATDPGRTLLGAVRAPVPPEVLAANGFDAGDGRDDWLVDGTPVPAAEVEQAHADWYREHPAAVGAGLARYGPTLERLAS